MKKVFLLTQETAERLEVLAKQGPTGFDSRDFRVVERADGRQVQLLNGSGSGRAGGGVPWRYHVWYGADTQKLYVEEGSLVQRDGAVPFYPTLSGVSIGERDGAGRPQGFGVGGSTPGTEYAVWVKYQSNAGEVKFGARADFDDEVDAAGSDDPVSGGVCERFRLLATVIFASGDAGLVVDEIRHWWQSDIELGVDVCDESDGSDGSDDGSDESDGSDDDSDGGGSDDSDDSDGSDGPGPSPCCPSVEVDAVALVDGDCFVSSFPASMLVLVTATVTGNPCNCRSAFVEITFAGQRQYFNLGFAGTGTVTGFFQIMGTPCTTYGGTVCWRTPVNIAGDACSSLECCEGFTVRAPAICDSGCSSDDSSDGSDDPGSDESDESVGSDESDGSGGSDDKTCIVPSVHSKTGFTALRCVESPEVWFVDIMRGILVDSRRVQVRIDPQFVEVCAMKSLVVTTVQADKAVTLGGRVVRDDKGFLCVELVRPWWCGAVRAVVTLQGIRRGFRDRFPEKTSAEYGKNKHFWEQL